MLAISVDTPEESRKLSQSEGYTYALLSDPRAEVIKKYGILHAGAGEDGRDIARPAEFLIDATGRIRWQNLTETFLVRAQPEQVLKEIEKLK